MSNLNLNSTIIMNDVSSENISPPENRDVSIENVFDVNNIELTSPCFVCKKSA